ncbi:MAG: chemotaxis protein CheW, partial [Nitrospiria bacterium]
VAEQGALFESGRHEMESWAEEESEIETEEPTEAMVLFSINGKDRYVVPLSEITRLEEFDLHKIEHSSGREVIQYRDDLLPLVRLDAVLQTETVHKKPDRIYAIVFTRHEKSVGVVVGQIIDIVEAGLHIHDTPGRKTGIKGSMIIEGHSTDLIEVEQMLACAMPEWAEKIAV